jgi:hypothetical protein
MTTALGDQPEPGVAAITHGARHRRLDRRKRTAEKVLAVLLLFAAFAVTVVLLGLQWLSNQGNASAASVLTSQTLHTSEVRPS